jgi:NodT family efflux transporter outer membrane factor (OMF) lipoprotein
MGLAALMLLMSGCFKVGPDFVKPEAPVAGEWAEAGDPRIRTEPSEYVDWWKVFNDSTLNTLIEMAYQQNLTLQIAGIRILEARAQLGIAVGEQFPQVQQFRGEAARVNLGENAPNSAGADRSHWDYTVGFDAAWELDFWGKFRRAVESGVANLEASVADYDDILVTLIAEVARTYVAIRTIEERLAVARENVLIQERSLQIAERRFEGGVVTDLDVQQAKALLAETQALIPQFQADRRRAKNALAILIGRLPFEIDQIVSEPKPIPAVPSQVVVDIPADLLRRRPDIRLAEFQVAAQGPLVGVAKADLYPHFVLFGSIGLHAGSRAGSSTGSGSSKASDLFDSDSFEVFAGPSFTWDIFNYGRIKNRVRVQDARFQQLIVNYENTVLRAHQEVEDALVDFLRGQEEETFLLESVTASRKSVELAELQYREGLVDYQRVLDTQRSLTVQEDRLSTTSGSVATSLIALYKALGGGWQIRVGKDYLPSDIREEMSERTNWGRLMAPEKLEPPANDKERKK